MQKLKIEALDGRQLAARVYAPAEPRAALIVLSALGVPQGYYEAFATTLAARDIAVLTFDYRGVADSADRPARRDPATLVEWAKLDAAGVIDAALWRFRGLPLWGLGHSFGGQAFGLTARGQDLDGIVVVAAGVGDFSLYPPALARRYRAQLAGVPLLRATLGYIPGWLGLGTDLPAGVIHQWASWCNTPGYAKGALPADKLHYHEVRAPMLFVDVEDDTYAPAAASAALRGWYDHARVEHRVVRPAELGVDKVGHFGIFRRGAPERVWAEIGERVVRGASAEVRVA